MQTPFGKSVNTSPAGLWLVAVGAAAMLFALVFDWLRGEAFDPGLTQLAGFVVGGFIALIGVGRLFFPRSLAWHGLLVLTYIAGVLFMGFWTDGRERRQDFGLLQDNSIDLRDAFINVVGFVPLGYLVLRFILSAKGAQPLFRWLVISLVFCASLSGLIETMQALVPGRISSLVDLTLNTFGAFVGALLCAFEIRMSRDNTPG